jgi:hypothetical protein
MASHGRAARGMLWVCLCNVDLAVSRHVPPRRPNGVAGTAAFGTITTAGDPRVVQLAVKWSF